MDEAERIIKSLQLKQHPEGGYYRETYRSIHEIGEKELGNAYQGKRNYATSIYFLLTADTFSAFHKIKQDEIWHFYKGTPIELHMISAEGIYSCVSIGNAIDIGQLPQFVVKGGCWFAARIEQNAKQDYALVGCTVSPGFDFRDFTLPNQKELIQLFPQHRKIVSELSRE
ncbi:MAG: cupin domain-containing protein [Bacteroidota bacterium]